MRLLYRKDGTKRRRSLIVGFAIGSAMAVGGAALAFWLIAGTGDAGTNTANTSNLTVSAVGGSGNLYPGGTGNLRFSVTNNNTYPVTISGIDVVATDAGFSQNGCGSAVRATIHTVAGHYTNADGTVLPVGTPVSITLPDASSMDNPSNLDQSCAISDYLTFPGAVTVSSTT